MQLAGQVALVTGGSSGLGRAAVRSLAQAGASVGLLGRTAGNVQEAAEEFRQAGYRDRR